MTDAVIREFAARSRMRVTPAVGGDSDVVLHGTILKETVVAAYLQHHHAAVVELSHYAGCLRHAE